jgi:putative SOS response-associated peptidase YedK
MCYHYGLAKDKATLENRYKAKAAQTLRLPFVRVGAFDSAAQHLPVITNAHPDHIQGMHWGLIPFWSRTGTIDVPTYNAVAATAHEKPTFQHAWGKQHCLVPADGFYEWQHQGSKKTPYFIWLPETPVFSFAGLWDVWTDPQTGAAVGSFSILTTTANPLMANIHNTKKRMPVMLPPHLEQEWLSATKTAAHEIVNVAQDIALAAQPAHPKLLQLGNNSAARKAPDGAQLGLFDGGF